MTRLAAVVLLLASLAGSAAAEGRVTAGIGLGLTQSKEDGAADPNNTLELYGRLKLNRRLAGQLEIQRIKTADYSNVDIRSASGLFVFDLGSSHLVPIALAGLGVDNVATQWDSTNYAHVFIGVGLEYRADNGLIIGADLRMGARVSTEPQYKDVQPLTGNVNTIALYTPAGLQEGEFRTARVTVGIRF